MTTSFSIPFSKPSIAEEEIAAVTQVLKSGWITAGPKVREFEENFAAYVGAKRAIAVTSCTAAIHISLLAANIRPGDEVIVPSMTWPATVNMVDLVGAKPVFADIDRSTMQITPETVQRAATPKTRAVIPVHFAGQSCDLDGLDKLCENRKWALIEDAAHAAGAEYQGRRIGSDGRMACFSFHPIKNITTGEGGMITTDSAELDANLRLLRFHGVSRDAWARYGGVTGMSDVRPPARYESVIAGYKYNMTDIQAALGVEQLKKLDSFIERRSHLADRYIQNLKDMNVLQIPGRASGTTRHAWHLFIVLLNLERIQITRDEMIAALASRGIGAGLHFTAVHLHKYYRDRYGCKPGLLPETEWAAERMMSLPLYPGMSERDVDSVVSAIRDICQAGR